MDLTIGYLYPDQMNIYGDTGNVICLKKRAEWRGIKVKVLDITFDTKLKPDQVDIYFFGGGQDQNQIEVSKDLQRIGKVIKTDIEKGVPCLTICGGYQLFGNYYKPHSGPKIGGIGIFPAYTHASYKRMIGNLVISSEFGNLVGFENHSGQTFLKSVAKPLGKVIKGFGNNGEDGTEGCIHKNVIGCYMHGSLLPKNLVLADWLIKKALEVKYRKNIELKRLDDSLETQAHDQAISKFG